MNQIFYSSTDSSIGPVHIASTANGVCAVSLSVSEGIFISGISKDGMPERNDERFRKLKKDLRDYFCGKRVDFSVYPLDISSGTEFQKRVWNKLIEIPYGERRSYKWLAEEIGSPDSFRAVAGANGRNPIPIIIPCHRVINSDGSLGGYSGGTWIKERLLKLEKGQEIPKATLKCD